jgi:hypothetical protein
MSALDKRRGAGEKSGMNFRPILILACLAAGLAIPASAQDRRRDVTPQRPEVLNQLTACRAIGDNAERLACYDRQVAALETAEAAREIAVVDRTQIRRARRSLFGLRLPDLGIFGDDSDQSEDGAAVNEINSTIQAITSGADGRVHYVLVEGGVWAQTEGRRGRPPRAGQAIRIRRGPLGSFMASVEGRPGVRVIRIR